MAPNQRAPLIGPSALLSRQLFGSCSGGAPASNRGAAGGNPTGRALALRAERCRRRREYQENVLSDRRTCCAGGHSCLEGGRTSERPGRAQARLEASRQMVIMAPERGRRRSSPDEPECERTSRAAILPVQFFIGVIIVCSTLSASCGAAEFGGPDSPASFNQRGNNWTPATAGLANDQEAAPSSPIANQQLRDLNLNLSLLGPMSDDNSSASTAGAQLEQQQETDEDRPLIIGIITANSIIFVIGLCGNAIVILVILRFTRIETVTDIYILNLAFADLMFILGLVFLITTMFIDHWIFGNLMCKLYMATTSLNQFASSLLLVVMSFDRFLAVCHPIYAQRFRRLRRAKIICLCIWITCLILMTPIFAFARTNKDLTCAIFWPDYKSFNCEIAFTLYSFGIGFALPLLLIAAFYICVIRKLRIAASGPLNLGSSRRSRTRENTNKRIEHLVIGIICTYTVCWLPYWITQLCVSFTTHLEHTPIQGFYSFFLIATSLSYTNSALNPILYAFLSDNFKRRCSDVFRSIYSISWCRPSPCAESHSTLTTTCCESELSRPESRQTTYLLNESVRLTSLHNNGAGEPPINNTNSNNNSSSCNNYGNRRAENVDGLTTLARSTLDPMAGHTERANPGGSAYDLEELADHLEVAEGEPSGRPGQSRQQADSRKKSVNFSVHTFVVQGLNSETVTSDLKALQTDKSGGHDV